jgi:peptide/nickel transport system permease protein
MFAYLVRRIAAIIPTLIFVSMLIFGLQQLLPGDPAVVLAGEDQDPNVVAYLRQKMHLDEPLPVRYLYWINGVLHGDLGESLRMQKPVRELILEKLPVTIELAAFAMIIALLIGVPMGILSAVKRNTAWDYGANAVALWGLSTPNFLARHHDDPACSRSRSGWLPGLRLREPVRGLEGEPGRADHAGLRAGQCDRGGADAAYPQRDAAGAVLRLLCAPRRAKGLSSAASF